MAAQATCELVDLDVFVRAVSLRDAAGAEDGARDALLRVPGQLGGRGEGLDSRCLSGVLERVDQGLDERVIRLGLGGREIDVAQLPGEAGRMFPQPGVGLA